MSGLNYRSSLIALVYVAITAIIAQLVNDVVGQAYLDEIFHIPQAQRYCNGQYKGYDPKLTTPPGLYLISVLIGRLRSLFNFNNGESQVGCNTVVQLRQTALFASLLLPYVLASYCLAESDTKTKDGNTVVQWQQKNLPISPMEAITRAEANPKQSAIQARSSLSIKQAQIDAKRRKGWWGISTRMLDDFELTLNVHTVAILPPMWFFGFLYYTDLPSTVFVVAMLAAAKRNQNILASLLGAISLTLRQTNIVWILFALGTSALNRLDSVGLDNQPLSQSSIWNQIKSIASVFNISAFKILFSTVLPYLPVFLASIAFILYNGSIVLGDHEHHQVSTHWVQPFYFVGFAVFFSWPTLLSALATARSQHTLTFKSIVYEIIIFCILTSLALTAIHLGTVEHPFLLADNRHYAFYFWRRIIKRNDWTKYALALPYSISIRAWWIVLSRKYSIFWLFGFIVCLSAAVIPSPLIEPRYFMIPYIIVRLGLIPEVKQKEENVTRSAIKDYTATVTPHRLAACFIELGWASIINCATLYLFLYKPFHWPDSVEWQRFLW